MAHTADVTLDFSAGVYNVYYIGITFSNGKHKEKRQAYTKELYFNVC